MPARLSPEVIEEARELVKRHGGIRPAVEATGIPYSTLYRHVNPERVRGYEAAYEAKDPQRLRDKNLRASRRYQVKMRDAGRCLTCGSPRLSNNYCWDCLNRRADRRVNKRAEEAGVATPIRSRP